MALLSHNPENRRQLGERLAAFVCSPSFRASGSNALVGVIADLVADDPDMGPPLKDLVTRPTFQNLLPFAAQGGAGVLAQRDSLLTELSRTYNPDIITAIDDILIGFLGIPTDPDSSQTKPTQDASYYSNSSSHVEIDHGSEFDEVNSDIEHLQNLLASKEWHQADRQTWTVLLNSIGSNDGYIAEEQWDLIPCELIKELDTIWSEGSSFRYGFSVQKAIWDEIISQMRARESHESVQLSLTAVEIFYTLLRSAEAKLDYFRPGFFPGHGALAQWDDWREEWYIAESDSGLISSFSLLCEKLRSCGPSFHEIPLDLRTVSLIKNLVNSAPFYPPEKIKTPVITQNNSPSFDSNSEYSGCTGLLLFVFAIVVIAVIAASVQDTSSPDQQPPGEPAASELNPSYQKLKKANLAKLDSLQSELKQAVFFHEIKPLTNQINSVQNIGFMTVKRKYTMISNANKRMPF